MTPHQHRTKMKTMNVIINRAESDDGWKERVKENLKSGHEVELQNFVYPDDEEACNLLGKTFGVKVLLKADKTICYFKRLKK